MNSGVNKSLSFNLCVCGPDGTSGEALDYGPEGPGSIPGVGGVEIFLLLFVSRLVLGPTQSPVKLLPGLSPGQRRPSVGLAIQPLN